MNPANAEERALEYDWLRGKAIGAQFVANETGAFHAMVDVPAPDLIALLNHINALERERAALMEIVVDALNMKIAWEQGEGMVEAVIALKDHLAALDGATDGD